MASYPSQFIKAIALFMLTVDAESSVGMSNLGRQDE